MGLLSLSDYYITTAIDYPNGPPHIGHLYEKIIADTYARWHRYLGSDAVFFLTGTDENGQKLQKSAVKNGWQDVAEFVDDNVAKFRDLCHKAQLTHSDFIRTSEERHRQTVTEMWQKLVDGGDIYAGEYSGLYCYSCEQFYPPNQVLMTAGKASCPIHHEPLAMLSEQGYYFKLSSYGDRILQYLRKHKDFIFPSSAYEEIVSRLLSEPLRDLPVSRIYDGWGIRVPNDPSCVIYTWFDALFNYYTPIHRGHSGHGRESVSWPADVHVIGKDINWFHSVIWPAMLMALGLELPKKLHVHGMILDGKGKKMAKSAGNVLCPMAMMELFPLDTLRYAFLRSITSGKDGKLSEQLIKTIHNGELANDLGNLVSRLIKLAIKMGLGKLLCEQTPLPEISRWQKVAADVKEKMDQHHHHQALDILFGEVSRINIELNECRPWSLSPEEPELARLLYGWHLEIFYLAGLLTSFLPDSSAAIISYLGTDLPPPRPPHQPEFGLTSPKALYPKL